jgi:4-hydroxy-tetrahydrodipicolinate synthase
MTSARDDSLFTGLSAFPLTPLRGEGIDEDAYTGLIERLVLAGVDSITALGSTAPMPTSTGMNAPVLRS